MIWPCTVDGRRDCDRRESVWIQRHQQTRLARARNRQYRQPVPGSRTTFQSEQLHARSTGRRQTVRALDASGVASLKIWGVRVKSGQAIKLFQITPYVNDFQTLNNPRS